ncbi:hypothetical protein [Methanolobus sp.]|uniref:hypothetical protein n=1 Tax=Methanolobus sp. TaxID=1874737 RepID=UPI0025DC5C0A|nr:hypothetical protein [Methanolobus sp.]
MSDLEDIEKSLTSSEQAAEDLLFYWSEISWYERDLVISSIMYLFQHDLSDIPDNMKNRIDTILEQVMEFQMLNAQSRPSRIRLLFDRKNKLRYDGQERPNHMVMMQVIETLSHAQQCELASYIGISDHSDVLESLRCAGNDTPQQVRFYALRGRVGKLYM